MDRIRMSIPAGEFFEFKTEFMGRFSANKNRNTSHDLTGTQ
jgi:queuine/archaeosine tRNA-ribosyltransferase